MGSLLYSPNFKSSEAELRKNHTEFLDSSNAFQQQLQPQLQQSSGLMRYRSAPSSVLLDLVDNNGGGAGCEDFRDFRFPRPSSPEVETVLARFISSCNAPDHLNDNGSNNHLFEERPVKQEAVDSVSKQNGYSNSPQMMYQAQQVHDLNSSSSFGAFKTTGLDNSSKMGDGNRSNLVRQTSSPAGFFPNLNVDNGMNFLLLYFFGLHCP